MGNATFTSKAYIMEFAIGSFYDAAGIWPQPCLTRLSLVLNQLWNKEPY